MYIASTFIRDRFQDNWIGIKNGIAYQHHKLRTAARYWQEYKRTFSELSACSHETLNDLGIRRSEIIRYATEAAASRVMKEQTK